MIDTLKLSEILRSFDGKLSLCQELVSSGLCNWDCCTYTDSFLLFLPGEWESAAALGFDLDQYEVLDENYFGGKKAVPKSKGCCVSTHGAKQESDRPKYKSIDCRVFPFWFEVQGSRLKIIKGNSCPLVRLGREIPEHQNRAQILAHSLMDDADIVTFLQNAKMINYVEEPAIQAMSVLSQ